MTTETPLAYLSFRAGDADREAFQLRQSLATRAGEEFVWLGSSDNAGQPGAAATGGALARTAVVLVVVGPGWLAAPSGTSRTSLSDPSDPVRRELLDAIERRLPMLVVLVRGARAPRAADLPVELTALAQRPSVEIDPARWEFDVAALAELVKPLLGLRRLRASSGTQRTAPMPLDAAQELRTRAARLAEGAQRSSHASRRTWWVAVGVVMVIAAASAWVWTENRGGPAEGRTGVDSARSPTLPAPGEGDVGAGQLETQAAVAAAMATAAARAAEAAAATPIPAGASAEEQARWSSEVLRLRDEADAARQRAADLARKAAEARPLAPVATPPPAASTPPIAPPPAAPTLSPAERQVPPREPPDAATPAVLASASSLSLANWAIATTTGCGAGELRAVGRNEITISRTSDGVLVSQTFQGTAGPWRLSTSGSGVFPAPRPTYEIESSGLWTREGARPFRSISRLTVTTRDGGLVPVGARGSQYRTECPGG